MTAIGNGNCIIVNTGTHRLGFKTAVCLNRRFPDDSGVGSHFQCDGNVVTNIHSRNIPEAFSIQNRIQHKPCLQAVGDRILYRL